MLSDINCATVPDNRASNGVSFAAELFGLLRYAGATPERYMALWSNLSYLESQGRPPQLDICIIDDTDTILLVGRVDRHFRGPIRSPDLFRTPLLPSMTATSCA
jgi:hypothetical protein